MFADTAKKFRAMPAIFACCALACTLLSATGCGQSFTSAASALNEGVCTDIAQLKQLDTESATSLFASDYTDELVAAGVDPVDVYGPMFSSLTYAVSSISIENNTATVQVTISNKDLNQVFQNYTAAVTNELASSDTREALAAMDDNTLNAHLAQILENCLADTSIALVQQTVDLTYVKDGSTWKLQDSDELISALLGGLDVSTASQAAQDKLVSTSDATTDEAASTEGDGSSDETATTEGGGSSEGDGSEQQSY